MTSLSHYRSSIISTTKRYLLLTIFIICQIHLSGCSEAKTDGSHKDHQASATSTVTVNTENMPPELAQGEGLYNNNCTRCHGAQGRGTDHGPPLIHKIYEPNHHADFAFQRAAAQGVRAHHWKFGNMPKIEGVTPDDVKEIIRYIRWLQQQAGIF